MIFKISLLFLIIYIFTINIHANDVTEHCEFYSKNGEYNKECEGFQSHFSPKRYIFYDVNAPEGFNLRRDVYVRVATFVRQLIDKEKHYQWNLVLPPWGNLFHWRSKDVGLQSQMPWGKFFDIESLKKYVPVLEMYEFIKEYPSYNGKSVLDIVYFLRNDEEMFKTGKFEDKNIVSDCSKSEVPYRRQSNGTFVGYFWDFTNVTARQIQCVTFHGTILDLQQNLKPDIYKTVMFDHMEIPLHYSYGSGEFWKARRSMRYNSKLYEAANEFRIMYLNSNDVDDKTEKLEDWTLEKKQRTAIGGPYLAVHLRRQDFLIGRSTSSPTIEDISTQIKKTLKLLNLNLVFIASDTDEREYNQLKNKLPGINIFRFLPTKSIKEKFKDGGIAIIDQIICSHARYFIGTHESTFTFRIQEDREILGFSANTTFNRFCGKQKKCSSESRWEIVWD